MTEGLSILADLNGQFNSSLSLFRRFYVCANDELRRAKTSGRVEDTTDIFRRRYARHMNDVPSIMEALSGNVVDV